MNELQLRAVLHVADRMQRDLYTAESEARVAAEAYAERRANYLKLQAQYAKLTEGLDAELLTNEARSKRQYSDYPISGVTIGAAVNPNCISNAGVMDGSIQPWKVWRVQPAAQPATVDE